MAYHTALIKRVLPQDTVGAVIVLGRAATALLAFRLAAYPPERTFVATRLKTILNSSLQTP